MRNAMMKHKQVLANLVEFKLVDFEEIDLPISILENKIIRELIIILDSKSGDKIFIMIDLSQQGGLTLWAKMKFKAEAEVFSVHITVQSAHLYVDSILAKLDLDMQKVVKTVQQRESTIISRGSISLSYE